MTNNNLSIFRLFALNAMAGCIDLLYAVEGAYFVPAIFDSGISPTYGAMLIAISPIMGIVFQSYKGTASDQCQCFWGRRRPFIVVLTIACLLGLLLFPFTKDIADLINKQDLRDVVLIVLVFTAIFFTDFSTGSIRVPVRAYLLDVIPQSQAKTGNIVFSICACVGASIGFGIDAVKWSSIFTSSNDFSFQIKFVCIVTCCLVSFCAISTLCSVKEQNPCDLTNDVKLVIVNEEVTKETQTDLDVSLSNASTIDSMFIVQMVNPPKACDCEADKNEMATSCCFFDNLFGSIKGNFIFMQYMSLPMIILCVSFFFALVGLYTQIYFFTSYMAEVVFDGDINAPENSTAYENYTDGIAFGSLALGIGAVISVMISLLLGPIIKLVGIKSVFIASYILLMVQSGVMIFINNVIVTVVLAPAIYIMLVAILSIPFILVSVYEAEGLLLRKSWPHSNVKVNGRACGMLSIALYIAQAIVLIVNGPLINLYGSTVAVMILTCAVSFLGALVAFFVKVPPTNNKQEEIGQNKVDFSCQTDSDEPHIPSNTPHVQCLNEEFIVIYNSNTCVSPYTI